MKDFMFIGVNLLVNLILGGIVLKLSADINTIHSNELKNQAIIESLIEQNKTLLLNQKQVNDAMISQSHYMSDIKHAVTQTVPAANSFNTSVLIGGLLFLAFGLAYVALSLPNNQLTSNIVDNSISKVDSQFSKNEVETLANMFKESNNLAGDNAKTLGTLVSESVKGISDNLSEVSDKITDISDRITQLDRDLTLDLRGIKVQAIDNHKDILYRLETIPQNLGTSEPLSRSISTGSIHSQISDSAPIIAEKVVQNPNSIDSIGVAVDSAIVTVQNTPTGEIISGLSMFATT